LGTYIYFCGTNPKHNQMKKALFILALVMASVCAKAQHYEYVYNVDTLTMQQLMADYVNQTHEIASFRSMELVSVGTAGGAAVFALGSTLIAAKDPETSKILLVGAGLLSVASVATGIAGYVKLKHDRLEVTPQGVVIKLTLKQPTILRN
jgi:hypothetical protein